MYFDGFGSVFGGAALGRSRTFCPQDVTCLRINFVNESAVSLAGTSQAKRADMAAAGKAIAEELCRQFPTLTGVL